MRRQPKAGRLKNPAPVWVDKIQSQKIQTTMPDVTEKEQLTAPHHHPRVFVLLATSSFLSFIIFSTDASPLRQTTFIGQRTSRPSTTRTQWRSPLLFSSPPAPPRRHPSSFFSPPRPSCHWDSHSTLGPRMSVTLPRPQPHSMGGCPPFKPPNQKTKRWKTNERRENRNPPNQPFLHLRREPIQNPIRANGWVR